MPASPIPPPTTPRWNPAEQWWEAAGRGEDRSTARLLQAEAAAGRTHRSVYELFAEMEERDAHFHSVLQTRVNGLLALPRRVVPAPPGDDAARRTAARVEDILAAIPRAESLWRALLDALAKGFAVVELAWDHDARGRIVVADWRAHPQEAFLFDDDGRLRLASPPFAGLGAAPPPAAPGRAATMTRAMIAPPPRRFIVHTVGADRRNPYGRGLAQRAFWLYWFKRNALRSWALFNERFGAPVAVARCGPGISEAERQRLEEILASTQSDCGVVIPEGVELRLLEAARGGDGASFSRFLDWCNDEMSKLVLGATLTTGEGRRSGSLALGSVHQLVRQDYIDADARALEALLGETILRWITDLNMGPAVAAPRLVIETECPTDLAARLAIDRGLLALGISLPMSYFHHRYGRPAPADGETPLRFDDANFYQYHLQFGVLTINEVRARLGLAPVPWGDRRTSAPETRVATATDSAEDDGNQIL